MMVMVISPHGKCIYPLTFHLFTFYNPAHHIVSSSHRHLTGIRIRGGWGDGEETTLNNFTGSSLSIDVIFSYFYVNDLLSHYLPFHSKYMSAYRIVMAVSEV